MPARHSKDSGSRAHYTNHERKKGIGGTQRAHLTAHSQLPFGYCSLGLGPITDGVATPSGHLYNREAILEYLLAKGRELKIQQAAYDEQQSQAYRDMHYEENKELAKAVASFAEGQDSIAGIVAQTAASVKLTGSHERKKRKIDTREEDEKLAMVKAVSPWVQTVI